MWVIIGKSLSQTCNTKYVNPVTLSHLQGLHSLLPASAPPWLTGMTLLGATTTNHTWNISRKHWYEIIYSNQRSQLLNVLLHHQQSMIFRVVPSWRNNPCDKLAKECESYSSTFRTKHYSWLLRKCNKLPGRSMISERRRAARIKPK